MFFLAISLQIIIISTIKLSNLLIISYGIFYKNLFN